MSHKGNFLSIDSEVRKTVISHDLGTDSFWAASTVGDGEIIAGPSGSTIKDKGK